jgi:hypothetical protein
MIEKFLFRTIPKLILNREQGMLNKIFKAVANLKNY